MQHTSIFIHNQGCHVVGALANVYENRFIPWRICSESAGVGLVDPPANCFLVRRPALDVNSMQQVSGLDGRGAMIQGHFDDSSNLARGTEVPRKDVDVTAAVPILGRPQLHFGCRADDIEVPSHGS